MELARAAPQHKFVLQDLEGAIVEAKRVSLRFRHPLCRSQFAFQRWAHEWPEAIADGTVTLEGSSRTHFMSSRIDNVTF